MSDIVDTIDGALADWEVSGDAMRWTPEPPKPVRGRVPAVADLGRVAVEMTSVAERFEAAMRDVAETLAAWNWSEVERIVNALRPRPGSLVIDRHEYRRRSRRRRR